MQALIGKVVLAVGISVGLLQISAVALTIPDYAVQVSGTVQSDPAQISLQWLPVESATGYSVFRKSQSSTNWGDAVATLGGDAAAYVDTNTVPGTAYEYHILRAATNYEAHGYILSGIQIPLIENRGKIILVVDASLATPLSAELSRLQQDLVGDGWTVLRHDVPRMQVDPANQDPAVSTARTDELATPKRLILADYLADRTRVNAVFLIGHVPVPYSGALGPDQHGDHIGAWPADAYYGDMEGLWTDFSVTRSDAADPRNRNVPGDGKFDQSILPGKVALEVGRVDMANLTFFGTSEVDLMRQYLNKDHNFRHRLITAAARGLIDDNLGVLPDGVPAENGWANFPPLLGPRPVSTGRWLSDLIRDDYLWAYGCGAGLFTQATGVAESAQFVVYDTKVIFTMLFGSYFGDWDSANNLLRAQLATASYTLTSAWVGRPNWFFHHMALGETIGFSTRLTQNNSGLYRGNTRPAGPVIPTDPNGNMNQVHIALMGDPTLRLQPVGPPSGLTGATNLLGGVDLSWSPPADSLLGYYVYRAPSADGPFTRISSSFVTDTNFTDLQPGSDSFYMVRTVRLETSGSGSYYNASQGVFTQVNLPAPPDEDNVWAGGRSQTWRISDAYGTAGTFPGWDEVEVDGALTLTATPTNRFTVRIVSINGSGSQSSGPASNFENNTYFTWPILTASGGVLAFDSAKLNLDTSGFQGDLGGGQFDLELSADGQTINLRFTPNHPPTAGLASYARAPDTPLQIPIADLLNRFTSDPDGDPRALTRFGTSTNGATIASDGTYIFYIPINNLLDTFSYTVQDVRPYRAGDNVRTATSTLTVRLTPASAVFTAYHAIEVEWQSEAGKLYQMQSRLDPERGDWVNQGDPIPGTGDKMSIFERASDVTKYYRVIAVQ